MFLSSEVAVNKDWLPPLIDVIRSDRHIIAVPHFDSLLSGYRFFQTPENLINIFSWTLQTLWMETPQVGKFLNSPVMTGAAFAIDKGFMDSIGSFNEGLPRGGGESLEFSFRAWMCGGSIKISTCSRVAVRNALEPHKIENPKNFRHIVELWLDIYKPLAYKQAVISAAMSEEEEQNLKIRKMFMKKYLSCESFKDYLKRTVNDLVIPSDDARYFGKLKSKTGYCVKHGDEASYQIKMIHCRPHMYEPDMLITFDTRGRIKHGSVCLDMVSETEVQFVKCDKKRNEQSWILTMDGLIKSTIQNQFCLKHETTSGGAQHLLAIKPCSPEDRTFIWEFIKY